VSDPSAVSISLNLSTPVPLPVVEKDPERKEVNEKKISY
jgi:hypothetical protein